MRPAHRAGEVDLRPDIELEREIAVGAWLNPPDTASAGYAPGRRRALTLLATLSLLLLAAGILVQGSIWDRVWILALAAGQAPWPVQMFWSSLTVAGFGWSCFILLLAADRRDGALVALMGPVVLFTSLVSYGLKQWLAVTRPAGSDIGGALAVVGERIQGLGSTPSGHALAAGATAALLVFWFGSSPRLRPACWAIGLLGAAVAMSRVMVGAHWPSDVLLGMAVGVGTVLAVLAFVAMGPFAALWQALAQASASPRGQRRVAAVEIIGVLGLLSTPTGYPLGWPMEGVLVLLGLASAGLRWREARAQEAEAAVAEAPASPGSGRGAGRG